MVETHFTQLLYSYRLQILSIKSYANRNLLASLKHQKAFMFISSKFWDPQACNCKRNHFRRKYVNE